MAKLKSFEQFVAEMDRTEEIEKDVVDTAEVDSKGPEEVEDEAKEVQEEEAEEAAEESEDDSDDDEDEDESDDDEDEDESDEDEDESDEDEDESEDDEESIEESEEVVNENKYASAGKLGYNDQFLDRRKSLSKTLSLDLGLNPKHEFGGGDWLGFDYVSLYATGGKKAGTIISDALTGKYTYDELKAAAAEFLGIKESKEIEEDNMDKAEPKALAEMLAELYEGSCKNEAKAYEEDAHDEHTIESYMKENAALVAGLAAKCLREMKEDYAVEAYEAACNEMVEAYTKKMNEMKEMDSAADADGLDESIQLFLEGYELLEEGWLKQVLGYTLFAPLTYTNLMYQLVMKKIKIKKMLKNETNPQKKEKLKQELKGMKYEEVKIKDKIEDQKAKMKDAANASKGSATPEEKAKYQKEKAKMQAKLDKQKEKLRKAQSQYNGLV